MKMATVFRWDHQRTKRQPETIRWFYTIQQAQFKNIWRPIQDLTNWNTRYKVYKMEHWRLGYRFEVGPWKKREATRNSWGDFTPLQPGRSQLPPPHTHTYFSVFGFKKLECRMKIVQNATLWTRLRFWGGAIKEERDNQKFLRWFPPSPGQSQLPHTHTYLFLDPKNWNVGWK